MFNMKKTILILAAAAGLWAGTAGRAGATNDATGVNAVAGPYTGTIHYTWQVNDTLVQGNGDLFYIQYTTNPATVVWDKNDAQIVISTSAASGSQQGYIIGGLDAGRNGAGVIESPTYTFKVWVELAGTPSADCPTIAAVPNTPVFPSVSATPYGGGLLLLENGVREADYAGRMAVDPQGNVYLVNTMPTCQDCGNDVVLRKYNSEGALQWVRVLNSGVRNGNDYGRAVAVNPFNGDVYVTGSLRNSTDEDIIVANYAANGELKWLINRPGAVGNDRGMAVLFDTYSGYVYAGGYTVQASSAGADAWLAKLSAGGVPVWEKIFNSTSSLNSEDYISGLAADASGYVYSSGQDYNSGANADMQIVKYDPSNGNKLGVMGYNSPGNGSDAASGIAVDPAGYAYLCGYEDRNDIGQGSNLLLRKYNLGLTTFTWTRTYDNPNTTYSKNEGAKNCAVDKFGGIYVAGYEYRMDLGQMSNSIYFKYTADGQLVSTRTYATQNEDYFYDVALSTTGGVLLAGQFGDSYGFYSFPQAGGSPFQLGSYAGQYTGSVQLNWTYPEAIVGGTQLHIQYSTAAAYAWNYANAQVNFSSGPVAAGTGDGYLVKGLPASRDAWGNSTTPTYYFMAWIGSTPMGPPVYAQARTPALNDIVNTYPQARFTFTENNAYDFATTMDSSGNIYQAYNIMSGASMEGGWGLRKYNKSSGRYDWTRFYNSTAATVNASPYFTIKSLAVAPSGVIYAAGSMDSSPTDMQDVYLAKIMPDGVMAWSQLYAGETMGMDSANAIGLDASGNIYLAGQIKNAGYQSALLKKVTPLGATVWTSMLDAVDQYTSKYFFGIAVTTSAVYAAGRKGIVMNDEDIWLVKYGLDSNAVLSEAEITNPGFDAAYGVAVGPDSDIYVAGKLYTANEDAWLGKFVNHDGAALQYIDASVYNSPGNMMDYNYGVTYYGGELYTAGYEMRNDLEQSDNIRVTKVNPSTLAALWTKTFDSGGSYTQERASAVMLDGSGVFAAAALMGKPGIYTFLPPSFMVGGRPGGYPGTAEVYWTSPYDLATGSTYYFQASTYTLNFAWDEANAQTVFYTTAPVSSGMYQSYNIGGLDASRSGTGAITSPNYYIKGWAFDGETVAPLSGWATTYANTPGVQDTAVTYPDSKVWSINNSYSWRNKSARDAAGNLYTVSNSWIDGASLFVLRKYRPDMSIAWTKFFAGRANEYVQAFAVTADYAGNVIVAGTRGSWETLTRNDIMAVKYDAAGSLLWSRNYDFANNYDDGYAVAADETGTLYLGGSVQNQVGNANFAYVLKTTADGVLLTTAAFNGNSGSWGNEITDLVFDATNTVVYVTGNINNSVTGGDAFVLKLDEDLLTLSTAVITGAGNNWDQGGGIAADGLGNVYAAASVYNGMETGSDIWLRKLDATVEPVMASEWTQSYNDPANSYDTAGNVAMDSMGSVYVTGAESRWDINQGENLFIRKFTADGGIIWSKSFNGGGSSYERGWDVHVDTAGYVYATGEFNGGFGVYRYRQIVFSNSNPLLSIFITSGTASAAAGGVPVVIMPFDQSGGVNPELMVIGSANASGYFSARLPAGMQYFVGISTPGFKPTIKDQLMDPYGSFMVNLIGDTTKYYRLYRKSAAEPGHTLNVFVSSGLVAGDYLMGEVFYSMNGDKAAYGIAKSTSFNTSITLHNVPPADGGVYGFNISVPGKNKAAMLYLNQAFPGVSNYVVDMTSAVSMVGYTVGGSTTPPSFQAVVRSTWGAPVEGTRVELSKWANIPARCDGHDPCWQKYLVYENLTDVNGRAVFNNVPLSTGSYNLEIKKQGYSNYGEGGNSDCAMAGAWGICISTPGYTVTRDYMLALATYTLTGVLKYNGVPLPNASIMLNGNNDWVSQGSDSYAQAYNPGVRTEARVKTGSDGSFTITGLTDGNARLNAEFMGNWRDLNAGNLQEDSSDDIRVTISSDSARKPTDSAVCLPGRVWVLDSSGACLAANNLQFNLAPAGGNALGTLYGSLTFVTTYTISGSSPLEIPASSPVVVMAMQNCDGDCQSRQLGFTSFSGTLNSATTDYTIALSSGVSYYVKIYSTEWAMLSSFNDAASFSSTDTVRMDFTLTRSGGLKGQLKFPDGTNFKPNYSTGDDDPDYYAADVEVRGKNVQFSDGSNVDEYGTFEYPNVPPGIYDIYIKPRGDGFRWPPVELENVSVSLGKTTEVKMTLSDGLVVQPQIFGLPEISTPAWTYTVIGVPSGFAMNQRNITELFFEEPQYYFNYSSTTATWDKKYMVPGQYDFYLTVGASYNPGADDQYRPQSYYQFANFIGQKRGLTIKKSDATPGTLAQPIPVTVLGSVGQGVMTGHITGSKIFTDQDFEKIFANFDSEIMPLIPAVMLYDTAGDLKGFGHAMPDEVAIGAFEGGIKEKNKQVVLDALVANPLRYLVWGVPPGRYTAVFVNPNYPPIAKEVQLPEDEAYEFNFDAQTLVVGGISGVVKSSDTGNILENARVYLKHRTVEKFAVTNSSGAFTFSNLPAGIYRLEVTKDGFVKTGQKTGLAGYDSAAFEFFMVPSESKITGKVYLGKFPSPSTSQGIKLVAYDETLNVQSPSSYLPKIEAQTGEDGSYELTGIIMGHLYKVSAFMEGKLPETLTVTALNGDTVVDDIVLRDVPPQITVKVRKSPDSVSKVDVIITSPKALVTTPVCRYTVGEEYISTAAVSLALVPGANNSYQGQFSVSSNRQYYAVFVAAGDGDNRMEKEIQYDQTNDAKTEQYIQDAAIAGGEVVMDQETEEYSGIELDAGAITTSSGTADFSNLVGGFFSALPSVKTVKTAKGNVTLDTAIRNLMASEIYNMDLANAQPNKPFTLTLKYDKERALNTNGLRIYQYDEAAGMWKEIPGNYTVDPMTGVVSVDVSSLELAYEGSGGGTSPLARKRMRMSSVRNGRYVPNSSTPAGQTGKFAVFTAKPDNNTTAFTGSFAVYNMPNPFSLKSKTVNVSADGGIAVAAGAYATNGTLIKYNLPAGKSGNLKFVIYNLAGEKVRTIDEGVRPGGYVHYSEWDGRNDTNQDCASGVYFMLTYVDGKKLGTKAHKMAIIK
ncbi:MAG: hypothetical protein A2X35_13045 [Elusimicrobia bacterium GWA2_61_42]|nr:MAG: hypothetical protein A2X35_13045 [Elusimicrobia bacterium GWA2_61_42]OGR77467.1 MAG: hypothetical protein A2X38_10315 [Elusimicrobia bacterium GWC2_61_25]